MKTDDLLDRPDSFEARLRTGLDHIATADPVADPGRFDPDAMTLATDVRHRRERRVAPALFAASVAALTVGGLAVIATRDSPPAASDQPSPPAADPTASQRAASIPNATSPTNDLLASGELCDDVGCSNFDPLPLAPGAATYYRSGAATAWGDESIHLDRFEHLTRCAELAADSSSCARIEGVAGVGLVDYVASDGTVGVEIGTTFTTISPNEYAQQWGPTQGGGEVSPVVVRGHDGLRYMNEDRPAVVWRESPGVLVWIAVDPSLEDRLFEIAEGVEEADPADLPATIPHRVVVPGLGEPWSAEDNDGDGVLVALHDGVECVGFGSVDHCGTDIDDSVVIRTAGDALQVSGSTPSDVVRVRVSTSPEVGAEVDTVLFAPYTSRFFNVFVGAGNTLDVEWIDADNEVVDATEVTRLVGALDAETGSASPSTTGETLPRPDAMVLGIVDASDTPGAGAAVEADLRRRGYTVVWLEDSTQQFEQSMLMPVDVPSDSSRQLLDVLGIGGFDTWTPSLIAGAIPETVTDVLVLGTDRLASNTTTVP